MSIWQIESSKPPDVFSTAVTALASYTVPRTASGPGQYLAQLLWQRGIAIDQLPGFLDADRYMPCPTSALGPELDRAVARLTLARDRGECLGIWGDIEVDGLVATALLLEGLEPWFGRVVYECPDRLTEGSGLTRSGLDALIADGAQMLVTMVAEPIALIEAAIAQGLTVIMIDGLRDRPLSIADQPNLIALRSRPLGRDHPLGTLPGVALAYKLIEALRDNLNPQSPDPSSDQSPPEYSPEGHIRKGDLGGQPPPAEAPKAQPPIDPLLDLVAIGLIANWVELRGDSRYLAQRGLAQLQQLMPGPAASTRRPGVTALLQWCLRAGDRPMDRSLGLGPRINAASQIQGDARLCIELLTCRDPLRSRRLAEQVELLNTRRKTIQRSLYAEVLARLPRRDRLSQPIVILAEIGWHLGVLGLVADQLVADLDRPVILFNLLADDSKTDPNAPNADPHRIAQGIARSVPGLDLYPLLQEQSALFDRLSPSGFSLSAANLPLLEARLSQQLRRPIADRQSADLTARPYADLQVTVADLGPGLFRDLKPLEPYDPGNPIPRLYLSNCRFEQIRQANLKDFKGQKQRYIKTECLIRDRTSPLGFPAYWLGHYADELPQGLSDIIGELDFNSQRKRYELRLIYLRPAQLEAAGLGVAHSIASPPIPWILDRRGRLSSQPIPDNALILNQLPQTWADLTPWLHQSIAEHRPLALTYSPTPQLPDSPTPHHNLLSIAKYLSRTHQLIDTDRLAKRLGIDDRLLPLTWNVLEDFGFEVTVKSGQVNISWNQVIDPDIQMRSIAIDSWLEAIEDALFQRNYFAVLPVETIRLMASQLMRGEPTESENMPI
jgi:single-stranded-DNA-specific exonuclease